MTKLERFVTEGNEKADEWAKAGAMLEEGLMAEARAEVKQERTELHVALQHAASFHCLVEEWKDCEELKPKPKEKRIFVNKQSEGKKHQTVKSGSRQVSMYETWKRKQIYEDDQNSCQKDWKNWEGAIWEDMIS